MKINVTINANGILAQMLILMFIQQLIVSVILKRILNTGNNTCTDIQASSNIVLILEETIILPLLLI